MADYDDTNVTDQHEDYESPLDLDKPLKLDINLIRCPNLCTRLPERYLKHLGHRVVEDFEKDRQTRYEWEQRMSTAMRLALQVTQRKSFPWEGAANVKFPLITIAAMQYQSRAYPALINGAKPVAAKPLRSMPKIRLPQMPPQQPGQQPDPRIQQMMQAFMAKAQAAKAEYDALVDRAEAIAAHMSYQILEEDEHWEEHQDRALLIQAILGCVFKKTYFDTVNGHFVSECVSPTHIVCDYFTKDIEHANRLTHIIYLSANECHEREVRGLFVPFVDGSPRPEPKLTYMLDEEANERTGLVQQPNDYDAPYELLEMQRCLDLDGDGYAEPYVVTVRYDTRQVMRVVPRFTRSCITFDDKKRVVRIDPVQAFTKYTFIPSPDGGFYDLGFGGLLGPINESIDSCLNQMLDAATMRNAGGGFLGRGFRNKKGEYRFRPGEWKTLDSSGDDLRKSVIPLPAPDPSPVMFQLMGLLIEYGEAIAGAVDILQGKNPGQNTPAETSRAMVEQGMKVFNGIFKRTHRAFTQELRKLFRLNCIFLSEDMPYYVKALPEPTQAAAALYKGAEVKITAAADPFYMSDAQRYNQASSVLAAAHSSPGFDLYQANLYYLEALKVGDPSRFLPDPKGPFAIQPMPNPQVQIAQLKEQGQTLKAQLDFKIKLLELVDSAEKRAMEIKLMEAQVVQILAEAKGVDTGHQIALLEAQIGAAKNHQQGTLEALKILQSGMQGGSDGQSSGAAGGVAGGMGGVAGVPGFASPFGDASTPPNGLGTGGTGPLPGGGGAR